MDRAEGTGQGIDAGFLHEADGGIRIGVDGCILLDAALPGTHAAHLGFHRGAGLGSHFHSGQGVPGILFVAQGRAVIHDTGEAQFQAPLHVIQVGAVIQVHTNRHLGLFGIVEHHGSHFLHGTETHFLVDLGVHDDHRLIQRLRRGNDGTGVGHGGGVEGAQGDFLLFCNLQNFFQGNKHGFLLIK